MVYNIVSNQSGTISMSSYRVTWKYLAGATCRRLMPVLGCGFFGSTDDVPGGGATDIVEPQALEVLGEGTVPASAVTGWLTLGNGVGLAHETVGPDGGTIVASDGLTIEVPAGAHDSPVVYTVESEVIVAHTFGTDLVAVTPLYRVTNGGGFAQETLVVTIPVQLAPDQFAMGFFYDAATGRLEGMPLLALTETSITISTRHFSDFMVLAPDGVNVGKKTSVDIDTGFRPGKDDWQFPNAGSAIASGGHCSGQSLSAMWYFDQQRVARGESPLYGLYDNTDSQIATSPWPAWSRGTSTKTG